MGEKEASIDDIDLQITKIERVMDNMSLEELTEFSKNFEEKIKSDVSQASAYLDELVNFYYLKLYIYINIKFYDYRSL